MIATSNLSPILVKLATQRVLQEVRALKRAMSIGIFKGSTRHAPYAVMDTGAEREVVGGVGWKILNFSDKSEPLHGRLNGMGSVNLPFVNAVTVVEDTDGRVVLIGVGEAGYDRRTTQFESLWNIYHMMNNGVIVDDIAKDVGGKQSFTVTDNFGKRSLIPLKFNGDIMTVACRMPIDEELLALKINWITPSMEEVHLSRYDVQRGRSKNINLRYLMMKKRYQKRSMLFMIILTLKLERVNVQIESGSNSWLFHQMRWWKEP